MRLPLKTGYFHPSPKGDVNGAFIRMIFCIPSITQQGHYMMFTFYKTTVWMEIESFWDLHMISNPAIISIFYASHLIFQYKYPCGYDYEPVIYRKRDC